MVGFVVSIPYTLASSIQPHDWLNNDYTLSSTLAANTDYYTNKLCYDATVPVASYDEPEEGCVFSGNNYELLRTMRYMAIRFGSESQFYPILSDDNEPMGHNWMYIVPNHDTLVYYGAVNGQTFMSVYDNFSTRLTKVDTAGYTAYSMSALTPDFVLHDSHGTPISVVPDTTTNSNSGQYALVDLANGGIVRVDVLTREQRAITGLQRHFSLDMWPWDTSMSASDDGKYVAVGGEYSPSEIRVYQLSGDCGDEYVDTLTVADVCPKTSIPYEEVESVGLEQSADSTHMLYFDDYNNVTAYFSDYNPTYFGCDDATPCPLYNRLKVTIGSTGTQTALLDYLAIGDSYTSGEGDVSKDARVSYYLPLTDFDGGCHLSSRSYPFLLRNYWSITTTKMHSVACSGARVNEDYLSNLSSYLGQSSQLAGLSASSKSQSQTNALQNYTPGVVPQLEFIRKYKPKIVTLTGGGNDIGFPMIIKTCATTFTVCSYAQQSSPDYYMLQQRIDNLYDDEMRLLQKIKQLSPSSKIYLLGYPKFFADSGGICSLNSAFINTAEISMINSNVIRLNTVLARAAQKSGVEYITVEDSLRNGRLCEGSAYMTGVVSTLLSSNSVASSFHPNAAGHQKIAETIENQTGASPARLQNNDTYINNFGSVLIDKLAIVNYMTMTTDTTTTQGTTVQVSLPPFTLLAGSIVKFFLHSDPVYLGELTVNSDGSLSGTVALPNNTPLGQHTLVLEGYSYSGEALAYYQNVTVESSNPNDRDGDGIPNIYDKCDFIPYWFDETTSKDVCAPGTLQPSSQLLSTSTQTSDTKQNTTFYSNPLVSALSQQPKDKEMPETPPNSPSQQQENTGWRIKLSILVASLVFLACILSVVYSNRKK